MSNLAHDNVSPIRPDLQVLERRVVDTDNGFTRIANELLEAIASADLTARQLKLMLAYVRKTYGFNKKTDRIADEQIAQLTGLSRQNVNKAKKELLSMNCLLMDGGLIGVNKEVSAWHFSKCLQVSNLVSNPETKTVSNLETLPVSNPETHKRHYSKDKKDINYSSENSGESSDPPSENIPAIRPDAAIQTPKGDKWGTADDLKAAEWIFSKVRNVSPTTQQPNWPAWANDIRLARNALKCTHLEICEVFKWANADAFWQTNVLSPAKLRQKWDTLKAQMNQPNRNRPVSADHQPAAHWNSEEAWENFI
ncbi:replication protein 15 [Pantoea rodasii]|uniref:Replication protein 15 n=1 Tax=Pantoea rodasii TaxID=1076549 RepID=A0A2M9WIE7_9GAMM|nr:replication protein [Pantoea rodasii]ORM64208.1 replication protein 15 [Pantoea rodasii]PJZ07335.1 replication protein 15 [Pantoea rodasii]